MTAPFAYVAYVDESGDDGIRRVRPIDRNGASEWFVLSALVIRAKDEQKIPQWHRDILAGSQQLAELHFNKMTDQHRLAACSYLAATSARIFAAVSWKPTMRGYRNPRAEGVAGRNIFYNFMVRVLLERVSAYCLRDSMMLYKRPAKLRIEFSRRGGMSYAHTRDYLAKLYFQSKNSRLYLNQHDIAWDVIDLEQIHHFDHAKRMALQLADIPAAAFFKALPEAGAGAGDLRFARLLKPRVAVGQDGVHFGTGLKLMFAVQRYRYETLPLMPEQRQLFELFGAPPLPAEELDWRPPGVGWQAPGP